MIMKLIIFPFFSFFFFFLHQSKLSNTSSFSKMKENGNRWVLIILISKVFYRRIRDFIFNFPSTKKKKKPIDILA